jgi:hypothetical protein
MKQLADQITTYDECLLDLAASGAKSAAFDEELGKAAACRGPFLF